MQQGTQMRNYIDSLGQVRRYNASIPILVITRIPYIDFDNSLPGAPLAPLSLQIATRRVGVRSGHGELLPPFPRRPTVHAWWRRRGPASCCGDAQSEWQR